MSDVPAPSASSGLDALKRIKAAESEWDEKVQSARRESDAALARRRADAEAAVKAVANSTESEHQRAVDDARAKADAEARTIVAEGEAAARAASSDAGKRPQDLEKRILAAVLGPLGPD